MLKKSNECADNRICEKGLHVQFLIVQKFNERKSSMCSDKVSKIRNLRLTPLCCP